MAKRNQFINAFVRQLGRETAHSVYQGLTSLTSDVKQIKSQFTVKFGWFRLVIDSIIGFLIPFIVVIPLVRGFKRLFGKKVNGSVLVTKAMYKSDRRYRSGCVYLGDCDEWVDVEVSRKECDIDLIRKVEFYGTVEIIFSFLYVILWIFMYIKCM